jgi:hypothetical protein
MIEKIMSKIKEKYDVTLNYRTENNILFFNGELKRVVVAGYVGEKAVTWDINLKFNEIRIMNEKVENEIESFFKMLQEIISR